MRALPPPPPPSASPLPRLRAPAAYSSPARPPPRADNATTTCGLPAVLSAGSSRLRRLQAAICNSPSRIQEVSSVSIVIAAAVDAAALRAQLAYLAFNNSAAVAAQYPCLLPAGVSAAGAFKLLFVNDTAPLSASPSPGALQLSRTASFSARPSGSVAASPSTAGTATAAATRSAAATGTGSASATATATPTDTASATALGSATATASHTAAATRSAAATGTGSASATATATPTDTASATALGSATATASHTAAATLSSRPTNVRDCTYGYTCSDTFYSTSAAASIYDCEQRCALDNTCTLFSYGAAGATATCSTTGTESVVACPTATCVLSNGALRIGTGAENSITDRGFFKQPFYASGSNWFQLTYSTKALDFAVTIGDIYASANAGTVMDISNVPPSALSVDYSGFVVTATSGGTSTGYGTIATVATFLIGGSSIRLRHVFTLGQNSKFIKSTTTITNLAGSPISDVRLFVGTGDDYVGTTDRPIKDRGSFVNNAFQVASSTGAVSPALKIYSGAEGVLFFSPTAGADSVYAGCCDFFRAYRTNPATLTPSSGSVDGSYALTITKPSIASCASSSFDWYYAAGSTSDLASIGSAVSAAASTVSSMGCDLYAGPTACSQGGLRTGSDTSAVCTHAY